MESYSQEECQQQRKKGSQKESQEIINKCIFHTAEHHIAKDGYSCIQRGLTKKIQVLNITHWKMPCRIIDLQYLTQQFNGYSSQDSSNNYARTVPQTEEDNIMLGIAIITSVVIVAVIIAYFAVTAEAVNEDSTTLSFQLVHI